MSPTKVRPPCKAAVPAKDGKHVNAVIMSFDQKQSVICEKAMKRMRAVESDSVKSARKAKDKLHKPLKERQKLVTELYTGRNKTECAWHSSGSRGGSMGFMEPLI